MAKKSFPRRCLAAWGREFNSDKFFARREKYQNSRSPVLRAFYGSYCTRVQNRFCAGIPMTARFDRTVVFPHGISGIYISVEAEIGGGTTIFQQVTIGSNSLPGTKRPGAPVIGKNVYIGAGAKIIGGIRIGDNVRIGAGCTVFEDVPDNATVVAARPVILEGRGVRDNAFYAVHSGTGGAR
ncbi:MAG: serine acetyltransferase [Oscillospiraceae bacterium]|jgi:serine O-acetyltransferase